MALEIKKETAPGKTVAKTENKPGAVAAPAIDAPAEHDDLSPENVANLLSTELSSEPAAPEASEVQPEATEETPAEEAPIEETPETEEEPAAQETPEEGELPAAFDTELNGLLEDVKEGKAVKDIAKRINKVVWQREEEKKRADSAEERAAQAEAALQQARTVQRPAGGLEAMNGDQLNKVEANATRIIDAAQNFLDEASDDDERAFIEGYMKSNRLETPQQLKRHLRALEKMVGTEIPARRNALKTFSAEEGKIAGGLKELTPWAFDPKHADFARVKATVDFVRQLNPNDPAALYNAICHTIGAKHLDSLIAKNKSGAPKTPAKAPLKIPAVPKAAPAPTVPRKAAALETVNSRFVKRPNSADAAALLAAELNGG